MSADEQAIRKLIGDWMAASARGDLAKVLSMMSDDVVFMTPGREPFGKQEFAAQSAGMKDMKIEGVANRSRSRCSATGPGCATTSPSRLLRKAGSRRRRAGYTLTILNRTPDGAWVITRDANLLG